MRPTILTSLPLVVGMFTTASAQIPATVTTLGPETTLERTIDSTETHTYGIALEENQYLQFVVMQHGIDLIVRVFSPAGKRLGEFDSPNGTEGPENVSIVAVAAGNYRISVSALDPNVLVKKGRYEIKTLELRDATEQERKVAQAEDERKAKGLALLAELIDTLPEIRLPQTRVRVKLQSAALLYIVDEKKSTELLTGALTEAKDYLATLSQEDESYFDAVQWMQQLRYEAVQTLAAHDPEAALNLFLSTRTPMAVNSLDEQRQERQFEISLASQVAARNPKRAYELAHDALKTGYSSTLVDTLKRLLQSDQELAANLARELMTRLLQEKLLKNYEAWDIALNLIRNSKSTVSAPDQNQAQLLNTQDYRALVQKVLNEGLSAPSSSAEVQNGNSPQRLLLSLKEILGNDLDALLPGASQAIKKKLAESGTNKIPDDWSRLDQAINSSSPDEARELIRQAPAELREHLIQRLAENNMRQGNLTQAKQLVDEKQMNPRQRRYVLNQMERQAAQMEASLGHMEEALKHAAKLEALSDRAQLVNELANRIGGGQKRAQALFLLATARGLLGVSLQAENQSHMNALINLAAAFSRYDSKRGFEILDPLVDQFNELSNAAKTLSGFGPDYFLNGELSLQNGNPLSAVALPLCSALGTLSLTDFDRAKLTADRLLLPEVRLNAYLSIAQQAIVPNGIYSPSAVYWNNLNR